MRCASFGIPVLVLAAHASAQCTSWAEGFGAEYLAETVRASLTFDDGTGAKVVHGGSFTHAGNRSLSFIGAWDGAHWTELGGGVDGPVGALHVHDFGQGPRLVVGGGFLTAGTTPASHVAVWDGSSWSALGAGFNADVLALETYDDGTGPALYAGGVFTQSGATSVSRIARWNGTSWAPLGPGVNSVVRALEAWGPTLYVGGEFSSAGALPTGRIASWDGSAWSALGVGVDAAVNALAVYIPPSTGIASLYVGGDFLAAGGVTAWRFARWSGHGWIPTLHLTGAVQSFSVHDEGGGPRLFVGGSFPNWQLARFDGNAFTSVGTGPALGQVLTITSQGSGPSFRLFAGGVSGYSLGTCASYWDGVQWRVTGDLVLVSAYQIAVARVAGRADLFAMGFPFHPQMGPGYPVLRWNDSAWEVIGMVPSGLDLVEYDDGNGPALYLGGSFTQIGSAPAANVARWNGTNWSPLGVGLNANASALGVHDDGSGPALYVSGDFTTAGGQPAMRIARWNGTSWSALGSLGDRAFAFASYDDGYGEKLIAAGEFMTAGGLPALRIAAWDGISWSPLGSGLNGDAYALAVHDDGAGAALYVGGEFTMAGGQPANRIARWDGLTWSAVGSGTNSTVSALRSHDTGTGRALFAGGGFTVAGGATTGPLARWDGSAWSAPALPLGYGGNPYVLELDTWDDGTGAGPALCVGGSFTSAGGLPSNGIAALRGCRITRFCAGDGLDPAVTTGCPCGNVGASGNGCAWHAGPAGAALAASGRIAPDDKLVLSASGMPALGPSTIFLKGDAVDPSGIAFGDGVRCADGSLVRLGTKINAGGVASYPEAGDAPISVRGGTPPGSGAIGWYQTYYRNAASFCTSATFNVTNGVRVVW